MGTNLLCVPETQSTSAMRGVKCVACDSPVVGTTDFRCRCAMVKERSNLDMSGAAKSCGSKDCASSRCAPACRHCAQQTYHRANANPRVKPRWITVSGVAMSSADKSVALDTATQLTCSEPKLYYEVNPCKSPSRVFLPTSSGQSSQLPASNSSQPADTHPAASSATGSLFQKQLQQTRYVQRLPHTFVARNINRVQSMPAHTSQQPCKEKASCRHRPTAAVSVKHSQSSPVSRVAVHAKEPPTYERALLQQVRERYTSKVSTKAACNAQPGATSMPLAETSSCTSEQEKLTLNSRIRQYPMIRALWQEHQRGACSQLATSSNAMSVTALEAPSASSPMLPSVGAFVDECGWTTDGPCHLRRPSSCQDLSSAIPSSSAHPAPSNDTCDSCRSCLAQMRYCRGGIYPNGFAPAAAYSCCPPYTGTQPRTSWVLSHSIMDLPPPPPYPPPRCPPSPTTLDAQLFT